MSFWKKLFGAKDSPKLFDAKDSPKAGPAKAVNDVALTALLSKDGTAGAAHERTSTQPLYSGPTFKMLLMSVSRSDMFLPFIQMTASQTGIVPKDIPEDKNWIKENLLWYERNPWYPPTAEEMLGMARKAWGDAVLDRSRNEILVRPWQLNALGSGGMMCVIRDKSLSKQRQLLRDIGPLPLHFSYVWHRAPQNLENQMRELILPLCSQYPHVSFRDGTMEIVSDSRCLDEEDVGAVHSTLKTLVDANGGELSRIVPKSCKHCSRTIPELFILKCPYCGKQTQ